MTDRVYATHILGETSDVTKINAFLCVKHRLHLVGVKRGNSVVLLNFEWIHFSVVLD